MLSYRGIHDIMIELVENTPNICEISASLNSVTRNKRKNKYINSPNKTVVGSDYVLQYKNHTSAI